MRAFVQVRSMAATHQDLAQQLSELQDKTEALAMSTTASAAIPAISSSRCLMRCAS